MYNFLCQTVPIFPIYIHIYTYGIHYCRIEFFEIAIESWPEWDLNPRPYIVYIYIEREREREVYIYVYTYINSENNKGARN